MKAFEKIKSSIEDAIAFAEGDTARGEIHVPAEVDVRAIRRSLGREPDQVCGALWSGPCAVERLEQGRSRPDSAARAYLIVIAREREAVDRALRAARAVWRAPQA